MKYSYIKPRKKTILTPEFKLMLTFFSITIFMLVSTYSFLLYKNKTFVTQKRMIIEKIYDLNNSINDMQNEIAYIEDEKNLAKKIYTQNSVLKESIKNLFDLVPDRITLSQASLLKNGLILQGITPNRDIYDFMLQAPLKSIFSQTYSSFYPASNGWLRFVSTNYIDKQDSKLEQEVDDEN